MGLFDLLKKNQEQTKVTRSALDEAQDPVDKGAGGKVAQLIENILDVGIDGQGPYASASKVAEQARRGKGGRDTDDAIDAVIGQHVRSAAAGGFVTSLGGFVTMPVAIPVNVFEFYVQATRMVGAVAHLRGYDLSDPHIRSAVLLTLAGQDPNEVLAKAGVPIGAVAGGRVTALGLKQLPKSALMVINKAVGFRVLRSVGDKALARFGKAIPLVGGALGAGMDGYMMKQIAEAAKREFPVIIEGQTAE